MGIFKCGSYTFNSDFESGNLGEVEELSNEEMSDSSKGDHPIGGSCREFNLWTSPDCAGSEFQNGNRTWFFFSLDGWKEEEEIKINIMNMNRQGKLYSQGMRPFWSCPACSPDWNPIPHPPQISYDESQFVLSFTFTFAPELVRAEKNNCIFFSFCYPYTFSTCLKKIETLSKDIKLENGLKKRGMEAIYFNREILTYSLDKLEVPLLTITSFSGITKKKEGCISGLFPEGISKRPFKFLNKKTFYITSRVHPGETPSSFVLDGFMDFITRPSDPRSKLLRDHYVFKVIPMLNPDGVVRGHYRTDSKGVNLNRTYKAPSREEHPTIFATKRVILEAHKERSLMFYVDLHGHATKRGCFMYGNSLDFERQISNCLFPKLISLNSAFFEMNACNFTERNMYTKGKSDNLSKDGSGRVAIFKETNLTHCYTLECNYNSGKKVNKISTAFGDSGRASPPLDVEDSPIRYSIEHFADVGKALAISVLDLDNKNPWSRILNSELKSLEEVTECVRDYVSKCVPYRLQTHRVTKSCSQGKGKLEKAASSPKSNIKDSRKAVKAETGSKLSNTKRNIDPSQEEDSKPSLSYKTLPKPSRTQLESQLKRRTRTNAMNETFIKIPQKDTAVVKLSSLSSSVSSSCQSLNSCTSNSKVKTNVNMGKSVKEKSKGVQNIVKGKKKPQPVKALLKTSCHSSWLFQENKEQTKEENAKFDRHSKGFTSSVRRSAVPMKKSIDPLLKTQKESNSKPALSETFIYQLDGVDKKSKESREEKESSYDSGAVTVLDMKLKVEEIQNKHIEHENPFSTSRYSSNPLSKKNMPKVNDSWEDSQSDVSASNRESAPKPQKPDKREGIQESVIRTGKALVSTVSGGKT